MKMRALVLRESGAEIENVDIDRAGPGEVLVRMVAAGICGSDLHAFHGVSGATSFPMVLGHEGSGVVEAVGDGVQTHAVGDQVVLASVDPCYRCVNCLRGNFYHCVSQPARPVRIRQGGHDIPSYAGIGSMAEYAVVAAPRAVRDPFGIDMGALATTGCGVLTGVGAILNSATPVPGDAVVVIGCGGVGLNVIQGAKLAGAGRIIAVDINDERLGPAKRFGATDLINPRSGDLLELVRGAAPGGVDLAFEVVGNPTLIVQALECLRPGGTCVVIGAADPTSTLEIPSRYFMLTEKRLTGSLMGHSLPERDIPKILELYRNGSLKLDELIGERFAFERWREAVSVTEAGRVARALLVF